MQGGKRIKQLSEYISQVEQGKHAMVMGIDYVVLSRNMYDAMLKKLEGNSPLDCIDDPIDLNKEQDMIMTEAHEQHKRDFPKRR